MKEAKVKGGLVLASPDAPDIGVCPECGAEVQNRQVTRMDGGFPYSHRHKAGKGKDCPNRYRPTRGSRL